ncbi:MAG: DUF4097 family beta strand repeat-containing protein [Thermomicrobiales bacterium]|nr:DUF4097 family beta strand repeat-containing protein [Thermomicrobiales bacterium]
MTNNDDLTRDLNDRIKELEDMTKELEDMTTELDDEKTKLEDNQDDESNEGNTANLARQEGLSLFFTASVDFTAPLNLRVTNNNGDIYVTSGDVDQVEIRAERTRGDDDVDHTHWFFQQIENEITLRPNWQIGSHMSGLANKLKAQLKEGFKGSDWTSKDFKFGFDVSYDLTVLIPRSLAADSQVWFKTANGDCFVSEIDASADVKTANGELKIELVSGDLTLHSANGDIFASSVTGNVSAATANGDVVVRSVTGAIDSNTANGDLKVEQVTGVVTLRAVNGDVSVKDSTVKGGRVGTVAGDIIVDANFVHLGVFAFDTVSGDINVSAQVPASGAGLSTSSVSGKTRVIGDWHETGKNKWAIGEGTGPQFSAKSVSGPMTFHGRTNADLEVVAAPEPPAPPAAPVAPEGKTGEVNINLDLELERAKGWLKDLAARFGEAIEVNKEGAPAPKDPEAPVPPVAPEPPLDPAAAEAAKSATAARRAALLERVKNGELSVDEALAQLEQDA